MTVDSDPVVGAAQAGRRPKSARGGPISRVPWWFVVPALSAYLIVFIWPSIQGAMSAFTDWRLTEPDRNYIGLENFRELAGDDAAIGSIKNTLIISIATVILSNVCGALLAVWLSTRLRVSSFARVLFFIPILLTPLVTSYMWGFILAPRGALNALLEKIGLDDLARPWLAEPRWALFWIIVVICWMSIGAPMIIYLAGLEGISEEVIEAAKVDGANSWQRLLYIQLPLLKPAATIALTLSTIFSLKVFDQVLALTGGGPGNKTDTLATYMYKNAFQLGRFGYATAIALVLTLIITAISVPLYGRLTREAVS